MMDFVIANMAPIIFVSMIVFLLFGFPVAFALAANGIVFGLIGIELGLLEPQLFQALPDRIYSVMTNETMLAVPFFTFMGLILERSGMAEDLLDTIGQLFGPIRGGLAYAVIFVGALLAATTGIVDADSAAGYPPEKMQWAASIVLKKEAKVHSTAIDEMRDEVEKILKKKNATDDKKN